MEFFDKTFKRYDGITTHLRIWGAEIIDKDYIIVAHHGMNDYANAFGLSAPYFAKNGIMTIALDARGFGRNQDRGRWGGTLPLIKDYQFLVQKVREKYPNSKIILLGESMGASVILSAFNHNISFPADGYILSAPGVWSRKDLHDWQRILLWLGDKLVGDVAFKPPEEVANSIIATDNQDVIKQSKHDEYLTSKTSPHLVTGLIALMEDGINAIPALGKNGEKILFLTGEKDTIIPRVATLRAVSQLPKAVEHIHYSNGYHLLLRDNGRKEVLDDICRFVKSL